MSTDSLSSIPEGLAGPVEPGSAPLVERLSRAIRGLVDRRAPLLEPLALIAIISLSTAWAMQPFLSSALAAQGPLAQDAAHLALWLSAALSPLAAFGKAVVAAVACWSVAIYLGEHLAVIKLLSTLCMAEVLFSIRDVALWATLAWRGTNGVRAPADLLVSFGPNALIHASSTLARLALASWDLFHVAWGLAVFFMIRAVFRLPLRSAGYLAASALSLRLLFGAASTMYGA